jgi:hypothetical protein
MKPLLLIVTSLFITVSQAYSQCGTTIIASDLSICTNVPSSTLFSADAGTYVIYWTNNDTSTGIPASGTGDILNVLPTSPGASLLYIEAIDPLNNCPTLYDTITIVVNETPNLNLTDTTICQGSVVVLNAGSNSLSCDFAEPICSGTTTTFPNMTNTTALIGNNYDCLASQPNPSWFYFKIDQPGDLTLNIIQSTNSSGSGIDVDFILYGPYSSYTEATTYCGNLGTAINGSAINNVVDCSYSTSSIENAIITNAQVGNVYILMITNYANESGYFTIYQTSGFASLDCSILNNNSSPTSYLWSTGDTTPWISVTPDDTTSYLVTATSNGCEYTDSSIVTVIPTPTVSVNNEVIASGESATLTAIGTPAGGTYNWSPSNETSSSIVVSPIVTTDYAVSYLLNGCSSEALATVDVVAGLSDQTTHSITVFPNPAQNSLSIQVSEPLIGSVFEIIDQQGRVLKTGEMQTQDQLITISEIKQGIYTIRIANRNLKFMKN